VCEKSFNFMNWPIQILLLQLNLHVTIMHLANSLYYVTMLLSMNMCVSTSSHMSTSLGHRTLDAHLIFDHPIPGGLANPKLIISCHKNNTCHCRKVPTEIWKTTFVFRDNFNITKFVNYTMFLWPLEQCFSTAGSRPVTGTWHQLYRAARCLRKLQYTTRFR